jgi:Xaa-Pro dipeptidase
LYQMSDIIKSIHESRQEKLGDLIRQAGLDCIVVNPGSSLLYLTGLSFHLMERPVVVFFFPDKKPVIVLPELEELKLNNLSFEVEPYTYNDNPKTWQEAFNKATQAARIERTVIGVEPLSLRVLELRFLEKAAPQAQFVSAEKSLSLLRICKDNAEVDRMRIAVEIAQKAFLATLETIKIGQTEREIAGELTLQLLRNGSDAEVAFPPIVSSGPDGANPHATPGERRLTSGDLVVVDWGATYNGYISDLTRTIAVGSIDGEWERIAQVVADANSAGRTIARPGIPAGDVDRAARAVIEKAGYRKYFTHRVGHGIGMQVHEEPYMYAENDLILMPGMTFTVEPGIYLSGVNGVRIEDNVVITQDGAESLSNLSRGLFRVE